MHNLISELVVHSGGTVLKIVRYDVNLVLHFSRIVDFPFLGWLEVSSGTCRCRVVLKRWLLGKTSFFCEQYGRTHRRHLLR